jgi:polyisoprenoid-binding protein YceI
MTVEKEYLPYRYFSLLILSIGLLQIAAGQTSKLTAIKEKSEFNYLLIHPLHKVEAVCRDFSCTIQYDDATHTIVNTSFSAEVSSFDSGNSNRDSHAMEVLDALTFPTVFFQSKNIKTSGQELLVTGDLTFHGITKPISFNATAASSGSNMTIQGKADVSLISFQIERPSLLFMPVEDTLRISFTMSFPSGKQDPK